MELSRLSELQGILLRENSTLTQGERAELIDALTDLINIRVWIDARIWEVK